MTVIKTPIAKLAESNRGGKVKKQKYMYKTEVSSKPKS